MRFMAATPLSRGSSRSEEHTSELQSQSNLVCRLLLEKKKNRRTVTRRLGRTGTDGATGEGSGASGRAVGGTLCTRSQVSRRHCWVDRCVREARLFTTA